MQKAALCFLVLLGSASAKTLTPAKVMDSRIPMSQESLETLTVKFVGDKFVYSAVLPTVPTDALLTKHCRAAMLNVLKSPASTKFPGKTDSTYHVRNGVYITAGLLDSANSYGALLRKQFMCASVFEGTAKGGRLYVFATLPGEY